MSRGREILVAKEFFESRFPQIIRAGELSEQENTDVQNSLLSWFRGQETSREASSRAKAGLCLRCYVSYHILGAVRKLVQDFGNHYHFYEEDILPFLLNDDGKTLISLNGQGTTQLILDSNGKTRESSFRLFGVEVLRTFKPNSQSQSLKNWTYYLTRQYPDLKNFLLKEYGLWLGSDWALLNKAEPGRLDGRDRILVEAFHAVYRRDRRQWRETGRCPDPSDTQLEEMLCFLQARGITLNSLGELRGELERIAELLRQAKISDERGHPHPQQIEELVEVDSNTGETVSKDLPDLSVANDPEEGERQDLLEFCQSQLLSALEQGIEQGISDRIAYLKKSKSYAALAPQFIPGSHLLYCQKIEVYFNVN